MVIISETLVILKTKKKENRITILVITIDTNRYNKEKTDDDE